MANKRHRKSRAFQHGVLHKMRSAECVRAGVKSNAVKMLIA